MKKKSLIKIGILGIGRGLSFIQDSNARTGMRLVALCDQWEDRLREVGKRYAVPAVYTDYDKFLEHDMDAVILANYFHQHAPFAIKALQAGKHVLSETIANATLAEGVALCRAVETSGLTYMFSENVPYTVFNQELQRLYRNGEIGRVTYAEGEYNHPASPDDLCRCGPGLNHWRNWIPSTYYLSHALGPLMCITDTMPLAVNALSIAAPELNAGTVRRNDPGSVILCRMNNGAVFRIFGLWLPGHGYWFRLHGTRGAMETVRGPGFFGPELIRVWHEDWDRHPGEPLDRTFKPEWPRKAGPAADSGHGGCDFWMNYHFAEAIRSGRPPYLDVYRGVAMSSAGIQAWRSALEDGRPFDIPDFRDREKRQAVADDHWSPFPEHAAPGQPPSSIRGFIQPTKAEVARARKLWQV